MNASQSITSRVRSSRSASRLAAGAAAFAIVGTFGLTAASPAHASTNAEIKACGVQAGTGYAEAGGYAQARWYNFSTKRYVSYGPWVKTGPGGCAWLSVPGGYDWDAEVYDAPSPGTHSTVSQFCFSVGDFPVDDGYTGYRAVPTGSTGGYALTKAVDQTYYVSCT